MTKHLEALIDDIVKTIDQELFDDFYNSKIAKNFDEVDDARDELRDILEEYVDAFDLLQVLYKAGLEDWDEYEDAVAAFGRPIYRE